MFLELEIVRLQYILHVPVNPKETLPEWQATALVLLPSANHWNKAFCVAVEPDPKLVVALADFLGSKKYNSVNYLFGYRAHWKTEGDLKIFRNRYRFRYKT